MGNNRSYGAGSRSVWAILVGDSALASALRCTIGDSSLSPLMAYEGPYDIPVSRHYRRSEVPES